MVQDTLSTLWAHTGPNHDWFEVLCPQSIESQLLSTTTQDFITGCLKTSSQAPSYASPKLRPSHLLTYLLTGVKCRATSVANKKVSLVEFSWDKYNSSWWEMHYDFLTNPSKHLKGRFGAVFLPTCVTHFRLRASKPIYKAWGIFQAVQNFA